MILEFFVISCLIFHVRRLRTITLNPHLNPGTLPWSSLELTVFQTCLIYECIGRGGQNNRTDVQKPNTISFAFEKNILIVLKTSLEECTVDTEKQDIWCATSATTSFKWCQTLCLLLRINICFQVQFCKQKNIHIIERPCDMLNAVSKMVIGYLGRVKLIWYLSPMRAAKVQASLRIRAVSPEPSLLAHTSSESRGTFRQKARSLAPLNGWACAVEICHDGMLEDTNSLDGAHLVNVPQKGAKY